MSTRILFVCLGNICRSPTAEAVCQDLIITRGLEGLIEVDSAGTGSWHIGEPPDARTQEAALMRGHDMAGQRARQVRSTDFHEFHYILAMDTQNLQALQGIQPQNHLATLDLFMKYTGSAAQQEVPDPYYGGTNGFNIVLDMVEEASAGLIDSILDTAVQDLKRT